MRNAPQTLIGIIRTAVTNWRKANSWSRETVAQEIVEAHERIDGPTITGITFDPPNKDAFSRAKVNGERIARWLDDETKDSTLLPANLLPSVLAAMPMDLRLSVLNEILLPLGVEARSSATATAADLNAPALVSSLVKEESEAVQSLLAAGQTPSPEALAAARKEALDLHEATAHTIRAIDAELAKHEGSKLRAVC